MPVTAQGVLLVARFNTIVARLRAHTEQLAANVWDELGSYDERDVARFVDAIGPTVRGAQVSVASAVDAYLAMLATVETGVGEAPKGIDVEAIADTARAGVTLEDEYRRPFVTVWGGLKNGDQWSDAVDAGRARVGSMVAADVMLAHRAAAATWMADDERIVGYRRVLSGGSCGLCAAASTQRYHRGDLMPIHPHCDCTVDAIFGAVDPGHVIDHERLQALRAQTDQDMSRGRLSHTHVEDDGTTLPAPKVVEHGEMGPMLVDAADHFDGPHDVAA